MRTSPAFGNIWMSSPPRRRQSAPGPPFSPSPEDSALRGTFGRLPILTPPFGAVANRALVPTGAARHHGFGRGRACGDSGELCALRSRDGGETLAAPVSTCVRRGPLALVPPGTVRLRRASTVACVRGPTWRSGSTDQPSPPVQLAEEHRPQFDELVGRGVIQDGVDRFTVVVRKRDEFVAVGDGVEKEPGGVVEAGTREQCGDV